MAGNREISDALIEVGKEIESLSPRFRMPRKISTKKGANHFFVGVMFDYQMDACRAWEAGYRIAEKYGGGKTNFWKRITGMKREKLYEFIRSGNDGKAWQRFPNKMTDNLQLAAKLILHKYDGDPRKIWQRQKDVEKVKGRFQKFRGIGPQLANMAVMILARDYGELGDEKSFPMVDPKEDVHTKRVFRRAGLTDDKTTVIEVARELNPDFPAMLDHPAWIIGMRYCSESNPKCGKCPIDKVCCKNFE